MKELQTNKIDAMLSVASEYCVYDEAKDFLELEVLEVEDNTRLKCKILGCRKPHFWKSIVKIACVAVLICLSLAFTACMCVPNIREVVWNTFVEWYEDHVEISFGSETEEPESESMEKSYPETIMSIFELTYCPNGYSKGTAVSTSVSYKVEYYNDEGEKMFYIMQNVVDDSNLYVDNESDEIIDMYINQYPAILVNYADSENTYMLIWQDDNYCYTIYGVFSSISELIDIAEGIK
jgi:hypothetical protein